MTKDMHIIWLWQIVCYPLSLNTHTGQCIWRVHYWTYVQLTYGGYWDYLWRCIFCLICLDVYSLIRLLYNTGMSNPISSVSWEQLTKWAESGVLCLFGMKLCSHMDPWWIRLETPYVTCKWKSIYMPVCAKECVRLHPVGLAVLCVWVCETRIPG